MSESQELGNPGQSHLAPDSVPELDDPGPVPGINEERNVHESPRHIVPSSVTKLDDPGPGIMDMDALSGPSHNVLSSAADTAREPDSDYIALSSNGSQDNIMETDFETTTADSNQNVSNSTDSKQDNQATLSSFFSQEKIQEEVVALSKSKYKTFNVPRNDYQRIINILNVSRKKKVSKDLTGGSSNCEIISTYNNWKVNSELLEKIPAELKIANKNLKSELKSQTNMKDFFKKVTIVKHSAGSSDSPDTVNNNRGPTEPPPPAQTSLHRTKSKASSLFRLLEMSDAEEKIIKEVSKIDQDLLNSKDVVKKLWDFKMNEKELVEKAAWEIKASKLFSQRKIIKTEIQGIKEQFHQAKDLLDKENNFKEAAGLPMEEVGPFLMERTNKGKDLIKRALIRLRSKDLLETLKDANHTLRRRISNMDMNHNPDTEMKFKCHKLESWEECLKVLDEKNWQPLSKNGNVRLSHYKTCLDIFRDLEMRGGDFISAGDLLGCLNITDKKMLALETLVSNLPILMARKNGTILLLNAVVFLRSDTQILDLMKIAKKEKEPENQIVVTEGIIHEGPRKEGSGRVRIVEENPEVLEKAKSYAESAGMAAHDRRRSEVGRFGFCMEDIQIFLKNSCFKEFPDKVPSLATIRRLFEPPSLSRNSKSYYKSDICARPGVKRNDAPGSGEHHPHKHECATGFRLSREFCSMFDDECCVISADNKAKIPIGIAAVNRLNSLSHKFFITDAGPNFPDHDVLRSGSLINPEGYLILNNRRQNSESSPDAAGAGRMLPTEPQDEPLEEPGAFSQNTPSQGNEDDTNASTVAENNTPDLVGGMSGEDNSTEIGEIQDEFWQFDGANDGSDSDQSDEFDINFLEHRPPSKRARIMSENEVDDPNINEDDEAQRPGNNDSSNSESGSDHEDEEDEDSEAFNVDPGKTVTGKDGKPHIAFGHTGKSYIFFKSHAFKSSNISRHVNDLLTMAQVEDCIKEKPVMCLLLDDGADWSGRSLQTLFYLGDLFIRLDLDMLIISRNAPGDSSKNPVERLWGLCNNKISGLILPARRPDQSQEESEDESIQLLINSCLKDLEFDGHEVVSVHVPCSSSLVNINGVVFENDHIEEEETVVIQQIMEDKKMDRKKLREKHPDIYKELKVILKHVDIRLHGYVFRKCHPRERNCSYCKNNPRRGSDQLWKCLPKKSSGGLFFDCEKDPERPGHYKTLLDLLKGGAKIKIKPDAMYEGYDRCKERGCLVTFKSKADGDRHYRLAHNDKNKPHHPQGFVCKFKVNNVPCGQVFSTDWFLKKHKNKENHINRRKRGGKS